MSGNTPRPCGRSRAMTPRPENCVMPRRQQLSTTTRATGDVRRPRAAHSYTLWAGSICRCVSSCSSPRLQRTKLLCFLTVQPALAFLSTLRVAHNLVLLCCCLPRGWPGSLACLQPRQLLACSFTQVIAVGRAKQARRAVQLRYPYRVSLSN